MLCGFLEQITPALPLNPWLSVNSKKQKINKIDIISHNETPGYYEEVYKNMTLQIIETQSLNIDGVSGATVTSRAFINGVKSGLSQALDKE